MGVSAAGEGKAQLATAVPGAPPFDLTLRAYNTGAVRMRILEHSELPPRWEVSAQRELPRGLPSPPLTLQL